MSSGGERTGSMLRENGKFGFIQQDNGEDDMFVLRPKDGGFPPLGTRVTYDVVVDSKTGRPRAENLQSEFADAQPMTPPMESDGAKSGVLARDTGKFGFIKQDDGGEDMFTLPPLPPVGSRVVYDVVVDAKTGRPRAENLRLEDGFMADGLALETGTLARDNGKFGFIKQDSGGEDMFVLPDAGGALPPLGSRVEYEVVTDPKTGRPRAENMQPEGTRAYFDQAPPNTQPRMEARSTGSATMAGPALETGTLIKDNGKFGFIQQDNGGENMFVLGTALPPLESRVEYEVVIDAKTGRPRAENMQPEGTRAYYSQEPANVQPRPVQPAHHQAPQSMQVDSRLSGVMIKDNGKFGFIQQDSGEENMFILAPLPPIGSRVLYEVITDEKTGRPRAANVDLEVAPPHEVAPPPRLLRPTVEPAHHQVDSRLSGVMIKDSGKFGFIQQDSGEENMFILAPLPPIGSRVLYDVITDEKTGRPRAANVDLEPAHHQAPPHGTRGTKVPLQPSPQSMHVDSRLSGVMIKDNGKFGFIQQDSGEENMFILAPLPPIGSRVLYDVITDEKTGRPRAANVDLEPAQHQARPHGTKVPHVLQPKPQSMQVDSRQSGVMIKHAGGTSGIKGKWGFIQQDSGEEKMFILAPLPPIGSRVVYDVVTDEKTGRPRAANVDLEPAHHQAPPHGTHGTSSQSMQVDSRRSGIMLKDTGKFGFIKQDCGEENMFMLPPLPPIGSRVTYDVVTDETNGRPRAANVDFEPPREVAPPPREVAPPPRLLRPTVAPARGSQQNAGSDEQTMAGPPQAGTLIKDNGKFGFIQQDSGGDDMYVMPQPGSKLPPLGSRVVYEVVTHAKSGRPTAKNLQLEPGGRTSSAQPAAWEEHQPAVSTGDQRLGSIIQNNGKFGFIQQDCGEDDMFFISQKGAEVGTRVFYHVVQDAKTGRPRAEDIQVEAAEVATKQSHSADTGSKQSSGARPSSKQDQAQQSHQRQEPFSAFQRHEPQEGQSVSAPYQSAPPPSSAPPIQTRAPLMRRTGSMLKPKGKDGFIQQDCGEEDMFMLPPPAGYPAEGTMLMYDVVIDASTGRPRAADVQAITLQPIAAQAAPQDESAGLSSGSHGFYGPAAGAKGKDKDARSEPYGGLH